MKIGRNSYRFFSKALFSAYLCLLAMLLSACVAVKNKDSLMPSFNETLFKASPIIDVDQITQLNQAQQDAFLHFYNDPKFALTPPHARVATYLGLLVDQFTYSEKTFTAQQTLDYLTGNCLSLTMLSTALAELVGVEIHYQLLDQNPIFSINDKLLVTTDHLRAVIKSTPKVVNGELSSRVSFTRIDYFNTNGLSYVDNVSVLNQKSLYYSNLAIEHLTKKDIDSAYTYAKKALDIYPDNASALNTMGILHRQRGDAVTAEKLYEFGALNYAKAPVFLGNYKSLLVSQGRDAEISTFLVAAEQKSHSTHPWEWVRAGKVAFNNGEYVDAVSYYKKALAIAPGIPEVHVYAGQASFAAGKESQSKKFFIDAYKLSKGTDDQPIYKEKLFALKGRRN